MQVHDNLGPPFKVSPKLGHVDIVFLLGFDP